MKLFQSYQLKSFPEISILDKITMIMESIKYIPDHANYSPQELNIFVMLVMASYNFENKKMIKYKTSALD